MTQPTSEQRWTSAQDQYAQPHLRLRLIASLINARKPSRVLDVGCGRGQLGALLAASSYVGCDFVPAPAACAFEYHQCDINADGLPDFSERFHVIACSGVLEYVIDVDAFLRQLRQALHDDGVIVGSLFNFRHIARLRTRLAGRSPHRHVDWKHSMTRSALQAACANADLTVQQWVPMTNGWRASPSIEDTIDSPAQLAPWRPWSRLFAHQFIFTAQR